jgi:hypothetical protein
VPGEVGGTIEDRGVYGLRKHRRDINPRIAPQLLAQALPKARTANLLVTYALTSGAVTRPHTEAMLINTPLPCSRKTGSAARAPCT